MTTDTTSSDSKKTGQTNKATQSATQTPLAPSGGTSFNEYEKQPEPYHLQAKPDPLTGSLVYEYPLTVPPGRLGLTPDLALSYSSQSTDITSPFEYGWSINIPFIERENKTGTDSMYSTNYFTSSADGELYPNSTSTTTESYGARNDSSFSKYVYKNNDFWQVTDKNGTVYTYGSTTAARQDDPGDSSHVYKWMLEEVRDTNNNYIKYEYYKSGGAIYPLKITYTGNGTTDGIFTVEFSRQSRSQTGFAYNTGFEVAASERVSEIDAKVNGVLARKYVLGYTSGDDGERGLLSSITETGQDNGGTQVSLPATSFSYQTSTSTGWTLDNDYASPVGFINTLSDDMGARIVDVNGDGLPDILYTPSVGSFAAYINHGNGYGFSNMASTWSVPSSFIGGASGHNDTGVRALDVNGDGLADILVANPNLSLAGYINNGHGWIASSTWTPPIDFATTYGSALIDDSARLADVNGDGLPDILYSLPNSGTFTYLNNGNGWNATSTTAWESPVYFLDSNIVDPGTRLVDINGDGMTDIMKAKSGSTYVTYINNGHGFTTDASWVSPVAFIEPGGQDDGVRFADVNGDALLDIVVSNTGSNTAYINNGHGFTQSSSWPAPHPFVDGNGLDQRARITDINGDGLPDILVANATSSEAWINKGKHADLLISATTSAGATMQVEYKATPTFTESGVSDLSNPDMPMVIETVRKITTSDGLSSDIVNTWTYGGGQYYFSSPVDRRLAGFATTTKTDAVGDVEKTYVHQGNGSALASGEYNDSQAKIGRPYRVEDYDSSGNLYSKTISKWDTADLGYGRSFVKLDQVVTAEYDGDTSHKDKAESYAYDSTYGNMSSKTAWGEVSGSDDGTFTDTGSDLANEYFAYATNTTQYVVGLPYRDTLINQSGSKVKETRDYYDGLSLGSVGGGKVTQDEHWISGSSYASTTKSYDGTYGLVTQLRDPNANLTTYTLDANHLYPATTTNALGQATGYTYDYSTGKVKQTYDPNGRLYATTYDGLGRPKTVSIPDPSGGSLVTKTAFTYTDSSTPGSTVVQETDYLSSATSTNAYTYYDGFSRPFQVRKEAEGGNYSVQDLAYNSRGLLGAESLQYFSSSTARTTATSTAVLFTDYTYDPLARVLAVSNAAGTTTTSYDDWTTHVTDADGKVKDYTKDAYGNLVTVVEHNGGTSYTTSYGYDRNNNLTTLTDALANVRNFTYDGLGRRLSAEDLHTSGDGTYGTWSYSYDVSGNLTEQTDPKSQVVDFTYDGLNRPLTENYTGGAGTEVQYGYDTCTDGVGRLCFATSTGAVSKVAYDPAGNVNSEIKVIDSMNYQTTYGYDRQANLTSIVFPNLSEVSYRYNSAGLPDSVSFKENGGVFSSVVDNLDYAPTGKVSYKRLANGAETFYTYDASSLYRLKNILTRVVGGGGGGGLGMMESGRQIDNLALLVQKSPLGAKMLALADEPTATADSGATLVSQDDASSTASVSAPEPAASSTAAAAPASLDDSTLAATSTDATSTVAVDSPTPLPSETVAPAPALPEQAQASKRQGNEHGWNFDATVEGNHGTYSFHEKWINYLSPGERWQPIDTTIATSSNGKQFEMKSAPFEAYFPLRSTGTATMHNDNRYNVLTHSAITAPPLSMTIRAEDVRDVPGRIVHGDLEIATGIQTDVTYVLYEGAYPEGDLIYYIDFGRAPRLEKLVRINNAPTKVSYGFTISYNAPVAFRAVSAAQVAAEQSGGRHEVPYTGTPAITKGKGLSVKAANSDDRGIGFEEFRIWDSGTVSGSGSEATRNITDVDATLTPNADGSYYLEKNVSAFFTNPVVYPVYTDTVASFSPDANPETSSVDGETIRDTNTSWADARSGSGTTFNGGDNGNLTCIQSEPVSAGRWIITRDVFLYDTSSLPDNISISSSTALLFSASQAQGYNNTETTYPSNLSLVASNPASHTGLVTSDFNIANWGTTRLSDTDIPIGTFVSGDRYYAHVLNAAGRATISTSSVTELGIRASNDLDNHEPTARSYSYAYSADRTGTSQDPTLLVEYTLLSHPPSAPTSLLTEGVVNPTLLTDSTPEFSAVYNDLDGGDLATNYRIQVASSSSFSATDWDSGETALASSTPVGNRIADISYAGSPLASSTTYYWRIKLYDNTGEEGDWSTATSTFSLQSGNAPQIPTALETEGQENPVNLSTHTPSFSAIYNDPNSGDTATDYRIQVSTTTTFASNLWDTGEAPFASSTPVGNRTQSVTYSGDTLYPATSYYWRIKFWDTGGLEGDWSTTTANFTIATSTGALQDITYTYDAVGNITAIHDYSDNNLDKTVEYSYDDLYRLTSASTTAASMLPYTRTYTYDALGNITSASDLGSYTYAGTGYANPDAVTSINGTSYSYDNNGNVTAAGSWSYTWDYRNRLTQSTNGTVTDTYAYDHTEQRVKQSVSGQNAFIYPNKYYTVQGATTTASIFLPDGSLLATMSGNGIATSTSYIHADHLGSTNVATDANASVVQTLDYYPYGAERLTSGSTSNDRHYIGQVYDPASSLYYLNARYYEGSRGQFLSQDPMFLSNPVSQLLPEPQSLNAYSYSNDNPITKSDPSGKFWWYGFYDWTGYSGVSGVMMKLGEVFGGHERGLAAQAQYANTIQEASANSGISPSLTDAIIYEEQSHLTPDEVLGREQLFPNIGSGGVGVMQVSGPIGQEYGGYTKAELARDPKKNIAAGTSYLGDISKKVGATNYTSIGQQYNGSVAYGQRINAQLQNPNYNANIFTTTISGALGYLQQAFAATTEAQKSAVQAILSAFSKK